MLQQAALGCNKLRRAATCRNAATARVLCTPVLRAMPHAIRVRHALRASLRYSDMCACHVHCAKYYGTIQRALCSMHTPGTHLHLDGPVRRPPTSARLKSVSVIFYSYSIIIRSYFLSTCLRFELTPHAHTCSWHSAKIADVGTSAFKNRVMIRSKLVYLRPDIPCGRTCVSACASYVNTYGCMCVHTYVRLCVRACVRTCARTCDARHDAWHAKAPPRRG